MADVFTDDKTTVNPIETLVGEGKKFKTIEDLAKSKIEADNFIATLTTENAAHKERLATLEADLATRKSVEDQLKAITTNKVVPTPSSTTVDDKGKGQVLTDEDLTNRVRAINEQEAQEAFARSNVLAATNKLIELYGSEEKAAEAVAKKAIELKVSKKFLQSTAAQSTEAFFTLIGVNEKTVVSPAAPRSELNSGAFGHRPSADQPAPGTYEEARNRQGRLDVKKLLDPKYLNDTMAAALANPDKFFSAA